MSRDKQISEMRYLADEMGKAISTEIEKRRIADERKLEEVLKANGWRKSTDVALEVIKEAEQILTAKIINIEEDFFYGTAAHWDATKKDCYEEVLVELAELKKKYTEEGK